MLKGKNQNLQSFRSQAVAESMGTSHRVIYERCLQALLQTQAKGCVLDFGAGQGTFVKMLKAACVFDSIEAIDLMKNQNFEDWHVADLNGNIPLEADRYDVITALEVIEHLENPRHVSREWYRLLKSGGLVVGSTPKVESWRSLLSLVFRGHYVDFLDNSYPAHITPLLQMDIYRILQEAGFSNVQFFYTDHGALPKITKLTWQSLSLGLLKGRRFSDNLFFIAQKT